MQSSLLQSMELHSFLSENMSYLVYKRSETTGTCPINNSNQKKNIFFLIFVKSI